MQVLPKLRVYTSISVEADITKSEIIKLIKERIEKYKFSFSGTFTDVHYSTFEIEEEIITVPASKSYWGTGRIDISIEDISEGKSTLKFELYSFYPAILYFIALFFSAFTLLLVFSDGLPESEIVLYLSLGIFTIALLFLILFIFLIEQVNRDATKKYVQRIIKDLSRQVAD